ncbi:hypothetical protein DXG01_009969 [Tephrocybe rancida]|nr:hypothetical protein DXG01_009969 [Tephrocybe rancida]
MTSAIQDEEKLPATGRSTTTRELWSYYIYYIGNNGLSGFNYGPSQFQNLLFLAGYDPTQEPFTVACNDNGCVLPYLGQIRDILLYKQSFYSQLELGPTMAAGVGVSFGWLGVDKPEQWRAGVALYILGFRYFARILAEELQCALTFWTAAFPGLARDLPEVQESLTEVTQGQKSIEEHAKLESLSRNRISNMSFTISSVGEVIILAVMVGILKGVKSDESTENNTKAFSILIAFSGGVWLLCAIPWFFFEQRRPGLALPPGTTFVTIGFMQVYVAFRECMKLKQTFLYLDRHWHSTKQLDLFRKAWVSSTQLFALSWGRVKLTLAAHSLFWLVQKKFKISTKAILTIWGLIGVHTDKFGFKHVWEIWCVPLDLDKHLTEEYRLYQAFYGLMVCPWYAYSQTMISEVSPLPQMFLFFALFSVVGKTSAFIGPFVSSAIITASGNNDNMPFAFLFGLGAFSTIFLWMVNTEKSRIECEAFLSAEEDRDAFKTDT